MESLSTNLPLHLHLQKSLSITPKFQPCTQLQLGKSHFFKTKCLPSSFLQQPTSNFSKISCSYTPQNHIIEPSTIHNFKKYAKRLAIVLIGSLLFLGRFNNRLALASSSAPNSGISTPLEEKRETQNGKDEDEGLYLKILEKNPRDVEALKVVLYGKMRKGKTKEAIKYVERLIDVEPDEVEWRLLQALSYELMGQLSKAKKLFKEILEERPLLLRALHGLALVMHKNREGPAVFEMLNKALVLARSEKRVTEERNIKILIAQMHVVKGNLEEGLKKFQDLVNEDPRDFRPYLCQVLDQEA
ncbi:tetratricopeptide repeat (TPR)-like superfamily protein isoform X2 [Tasmannia lanceolata]|uniref:tetratricopeptide repeat (TPR)-like superfamily protein isoform X2 n=1 Tax=Tasmannia lanceolata TaxID=3420 RepID=UPI0040634E8C